jgi:SAM-dependent methyltransferase
MKNAKSWRETKIINRRGKYTYNPSYGIGSFIISRLVIDRLFYFFKSTESPSSILDIGCGYMPHYVFFRERLSFKNYIGIDWENSPHSSGNVDFFMNLNQPLDIKGEFDFILLMDVLEHLHDIDTVLGSLKNNLTQNGKIFITIPFYYWIHEAPYDYNRYTIYQLKYRLESYGFKVDNYEIVGGFGTCLLDLISKNILRPLRLNNGIIRYMLLKLNNLFDFLGLNKNRESYPIEYIIKASHL